MTEKPTAGHEMKWGRSLEKLVRPLYVSERLNWSNAAITSVTDDSRRVRAGALFVAVRGEQCDGHDYILDAARRGAAAVLCQRLPSVLPQCPVLRVPDTRYALSAVAARFYGTMESGMKAIGVTGTDGKTTTSYLIRSILEKAGRHVGLTGTLRYVLGARSIESNQTTPHPLVLHSMLREMRCRNITHAVMEVSSHALVHRRVAHVPFDVAVLTNVTEDHLDFHGTIEEYIRAKRLLFKQLSPHAVAVLNADSPVCHRYARATRATVITYGRHAVADIMLLKSSQDIDGAELVIRNPLETYTVRTSLVGDFNCENILAAAAVGFISGADASVVRDAIGTFSGVPGRLEKVGRDLGAEGPSFLVDYAHTPNALQKILSTLRPLTRGQLICVFGCGGNREREKRAKMGHIATQHADVTVITSDNSRHERTEDILADIVAGIDKTGGRYLVEPDRRRAIESAFDLAGSADDVIVACGKGTERFQYIGDAKLPFDDRAVGREVMQRALSKKRKSA